MRSILLITLIVVTSLISFWFGRFSMQPKGSVPLNKLPDSYRQALLTSYPWLKDAREVHLNDYAIYVPKNQANGEVLITYMNRIIGMDKYNITLGLDTEKNGVVVLSDDKHNGLFNSLSYDYFDDAGHVIGTAYDFNRTAQPGLKTVYNPKETFVWIPDKWRKLIKKDGVAGVEIDGVWKKVNKVYGGYVLAQ